MEQGFAGFIFYRKSKNICERKEEPSPENEEEKLTETEQTEPVAPVVVGVTVYNFMQEKIVFWVTYILVLKV